MAKTTKHINNFTAGRFTFAAAVIFSHSFGFFCAPPSAEPLLRLTHTTTVGTVAVTGFFGISGYLVAGSYLTSRTTTDYLIKRALRIIPAFAGVTVLFYALFVPAITGHFERPSILAALTLMPPPNGLNAALWTIPCEVRCYLILAVMGAAGFFRQPNRTTWLAVILCLAVTIPTTPATQLALIDPARFPALLATFLAGAAFRQAVFNPTAPRAAVAALLAGASLFSPSTAPAGLAIFGTYAVLYLCLKAHCCSSLSRYRGTDISYGVYLYAWPVSSLLKTHVPAIGPLLLSTATIAVASALGLASWVLVEQPAINLSRFIAERRTVQQYEAGDREIPELIARVLRLALNTPSLLPSLVAAGKQFVITPDQSSS